MLAWIDIENPPQVQYLLPLSVGLHERGHAVTLTARDYGDTYALLRRRGATFTAIGRHFGASKVAKATGSLRRARDLRRWLRKERPDFVVSVSRSAAIAARSLDIPSFVLCDYEHVNMSVFKATRSFILHPDVIRAESFRARGVRSDRLVPFSGIKEDITFSGVEVDALKPHRFPGLEDGLLKILFRPPAEESHYHRSSSTDMAMGVLHRLAARDDAVVLFSPRYSWQVATLDAIEWRRQPVILDDAVDFGPLYMGVDVVVSGGGTMIREAAYLGVPALTIFQGTLGDVDRYLESFGRITVLRSPGELDTLDLASLERTTPLRLNPGARDDVLEAGPEIVDERSSSAKAASPVKAASACPSRTDAL